MPDCDAARPTFSAGTALVLAELCNAAYLYELPARDGILQLDLTRFVRIRHTLAALSESRRLSITLLLAALVLSACSTPTLVQVARRRQAGVNGETAKDDVRVGYHLTDLDVLNFSDEVKKKLGHRSSFHMGVRYGSAGAQGTLGALAGAATAIGWGVRAASGLGLGATYIFGMSQIFDAKAHAQAYEQAFTAIQAAEATFYFHQLGMKFDEGTDGHKTVDISAATNRGDIPSEKYLTPDGETLYYRVSKILKVLDDTLAAKIPDLQDLKDAHGEATGGGSPAKPTTATTKSVPPSQGTNAVPAPVPSPLP